MREANFRFGLSSSQWVGEWRDINVSALQVTIKYPYIERFIVRPPLFL